MTVRLFAAAPPDGVQVQSDGERLVLSDWFGLRRLAVQGDGVTLGCGFLPPGDQRFTVCGHLVAEAG